VLLGGRAAEELVFDDITGGASNDIEKATSIARKMVKLLGMSKKLGLIKYGESNELQYLGYGYGEQRDYSDKTADLIDEEVREIVQHAYVEAKRILEQNREILNKIAEELLVKEVIEDDEFEVFFKDVKNLPDQSEEAQE
jgi:cell division protease FtsH